MREYSPYIMPIESLQTEFLIPYKPPISHVDLVVVEDDLRPALAAVDGKAFIVAVTITGLLCRNIH